MIDGPQDALEWWCCAAIATLAVMASAVYIGWWLYDELTNMEK